MTSRTASGAKLLDGLESKHHCQSGVSLPRGRMRRQHEGRPHRPQESFIDVFPRPRPGGGLLWNFSTNAIVIGGSVYAPVAGRAAMITGCLLVRQLMAAPYQLGAPGLLGPSPGFPWTTAGSVLVTLLFAYAGCLIGVRGLRPVWKSGSPSDSGLILAMLLFFVPFLHGVAVLIGGIAADLAKLLLLLLAFHLTYTSRIRKKELKRGGRETLLTTS